MASAGTVISHTDLCRAGRLIRWTPRSRCTASKQAPTPASFPSPGGCAWGLPLGAGPSGPFGARLAERAGFEPAVPLRVRRLSKPVLSATQPPLRGRGTSVGRPYIQPRSAGDAGRRRGCGAGGAGGRGAAVGSRASGHDGVASWPGRPSPALDHPPSRPPRGELGVPAPGGERLLASPDLADDAVQETLLVSLNRTRPRHRRDARVADGRAQERRAQLPPRRRPARRARASHARPRDTATSAEAIREREETRAPADRGRAHAPRPAARGDPAPLRRGPAAARDRAAAPARPSRPSTTACAARSPCSANASTSNPGTRLPRGHGGGEPAAGARRFRGVVAERRERRARRGRNRRGEEDRPGHRRAPPRRRGGDLHVDAAPRAERVARSSGTALSATSPGSESRDGPHLEGSGRTQPLPEKPAKGTSLLFGHVISAKTEAPVAGARVLAFSFEGLRLLPEQTTDASGAFAFPETKDRTGAFHLVVRHPEFAPHVEARRKRWPRDARSACAVRRGSWAASNPRTAKGGRSAAACAR